MRIGIYDPYLDDLGGGEKYMMAIAQCLSQENSVDVFWDNQKDIDAISHRFSLDLSRIRTVPNIFSKRHSAFQRLLSTKGYDSIIFLSDGSLPWVASKKLFVHIQQPLAAFQSISLFDKLKISRVNKFFCNSLYTQSFITKYFSLKTTVLYPPVLLSPQDIKKENIILHVGRFRVKNVSNSDYKKQGIMINTFKEMIDKGLTGWEFILAVSIQTTDEEAFKRMENSAKGYPIRFLVNQTNDTLWKIYSRAKIYWHASGFGEDLEKHPEFAEHFGISTVEAMGAGVVPVVINAGGQKEIVQEGKNGLLWNTLEDLQRKTLLLIQDKKLWIQLSQNAKKTAQIFSGDTFCEKVKALII